MTPRELDHAIQTGFDGALTEAELLELRAVLKSDPAARALYYEYAALHQALIFRISRVTSIDSARSLADARLRIQSRRSVRLSFAVAAAVLLALGIAMKMILVPAPALATYRKAPGSLYGIEQSGEGKNRAPGELDERATVNLTQGTFEFTLRNGTRGVVLAPAKFELRSDMEMHLRQGTAWFDVSEEGKGFRVITPKLRVTDLGTRFGVTADAESGDEVHVFSGLVRASAPHGFEEDLTTGQARLCATDGKLESIPANPGNFLTRLPEKSATGLIFNGGFEAGSRPPDANFGAKASSALLPGWNFGSDVSVTLCSANGRLGHGPGSGNIVSSTADVQVGFRNAPKPNYEVGTLDDSIWQTFATVPLREYVVSFEMGGFFYSKGDLRITARVHDGIATSGPSLGKVSERRAAKGSHSSGYNPPVSFTFTARSALTTLVFTETSPNSDVATPAIDNVIVTEWRSNDPPPEK